MKRLDFINKSLRLKFEARAYTKNVDDAIAKYNRVFAKRIKPLTFDPQLSYFYHPSEGHKNGELLFLTVSTGLARYVIYKYFN